MGLAEKSRTLRWFMRRLREYATLPRFFYDRYFGSAETAPRAIVHPWCRSRAMRPEEAIRYLTGGDLDESPSPEEGVAATCDPASAATDEVFIYYPCAIDQKFPRVFNRAKQTPAVRSEAATAGPGMLDLIYALAADLQPRKVVETGVAHGWSSLAILLAIQDCKEARLISTDRPGGSVAAENIGCVVPENLANQWELLRQSDREALPKILARWPEIDMCHYDSAKDYASRMWASRLIWEALRPGGFFVIDDIDGNFAYRDFCIETNQSPLIVGLKGKQTNGKFVGVLKKPGGR